MNTVTRDHVIAYLVKCGPGELIQILAPALHAHRDFGSVERRLALCQLTRSDHPESGEPVWTDIEVIAAAAGPEKSAYSESDWYWESGFCEKCRMEIKSAGKEAYCPICDSTVHLT